MAEVIHIKDAPPGWRDDPRYVYIGRPKKGLGDGYFGNPFPVGAERTREESIACYERHARSRAKAEPRFAREVRNLHDKILVCFCAPKPCHGSILADMSRELQEEDIDEAGGDFLDCVM